MPSRQLPADGFDFFVEHDEFFEINLPQIFQKAQKQTDDFHIFPRRLDSFFSFFKTAVGAIYIGDHLNGFFFDAFAQREFIFPGKIFGEAEQLDQKIIAGAIDGQVVVSGHRIIFSFSITFSLPCQNQKYNFCFYFSYIFQTQKSGCTFNGMNSSKNFIY